MIQKFAFAALCAFSIGSAANAATVVVNHIYNPANIIPSSLVGELLATPFTLGVGDTLDITITFTGGVSVTATGEDGLWFLSLTSEAATLQTSGTLELLGASANVVPGPIPLSQENSFIHVGSYYFSGLYRTDAAPISFSGLRQIITIDSDDLGSSREYSNVVLTHFDGTFVAGVIPEPATWAMLITGFGFVGAAMRRRRVAAA